MTFENLNRSYLLHLPPVIKEQKALPLVIVIHGATGNAISMALLSRMSPKADQEGFIVVYPNGTDGTNNDRFNGSFYWNVGYCCGPAIRAGVNDVGFIWALIEKLEKSYKIDPKRIYVTGFSNGGMMSHLLGVELSDKLAAIAPVAGMLENNPKTALQPVPVIAIHGLDDNVVPYSAGAKAVTYWARTNQCTATPQKQDNGKVITETYAGCSKGAEVVLYSVKGLGHSWPMQSLLDPNAPISATDLIWEFFASHPKA
jgi:polyhydroxybutyrate depolymerase